MESYKWLFSLFYLLPLPSSSLMQSVVFVKCYCIEMDSWLRMHRSPGSTLKYSQLTCNVFSSFTQQWLLNLNRSERRLRSDISWIDDGEAWRDRSVSDIFQPKIFSCITHCHITFHAYMKSAPSYPKNLPKSRCCTIVHNQLSTNIKTLHISEPATSHKNNLP